MIDLSFVLGLYRKYETDLKKVRQEQAQLYLDYGYLPEESPTLGRKIVASAKRMQGYIKRHALLKPQLDDVEAEITYLLMREFKPKTIVEVSPCGGWSSTWILRAIRDNGVGHLYSFDLIDASEKNIPRELSEGKRTFVQGMIQESLHRLPEKIDYLFVDSDHSAKFAHWYIENLFSRVRDGIPVSVHDVYHTADPSGFDTEGGVVIDWLKGRKIEPFTASPAKNPTAFTQIEEWKAQKGLADRIHKSAYNSMIYFTMVR